MAQYSLSVIIPTYNEEKDVIGSVHATLDALNQYDIDYEVIIVNDGSKDKTLELVIGEFEKNPLIKIINKEKNGGFGSAVKTGFKYANKEKVIFVPVDSPLSVSIYQSFHDHIHKADVIVSYRKERKGYNLRMKFNSGVFHFLIYHLFPIKLKDYNWIHLYTAKLFQEDKIWVQSDGIFMLPEILIKCYWAGYTFYEVPVDHSERNNGIPTNATYKATFFTGFDLLIFYLRFLFQGPFLK